jgi:hypothetical protein
MRTDADLISGDSNASLIDLTAPPNGTRSNAQGLVVPSTPDDVTTGGIIRSSQAPDFKAVFEQLALILAPTSLVTGLFYWMGWSFTKAYWSVFGVDQALLHYSTTDYLLRSTLPAFPFVTMLLISAVVLIVVHRTLTRLRARVQPFTLQVVEWAIRVVGLFCAGVALADLFPRELSRLDFVDLASRGPLLGPTFGAFGGLLVAYASNLRSSTSAAVQQRESLESRRTRRLLTGLAAGLVVLAIFLWADRYTSYLGKEWASYDAAHPKTLPVVDVYSPKRLGIMANGTQETPLFADEATYGFHYTGLRLLRYSGKTYFLLPDGERRTLLLTESEGLRVELSRK